MCDEEKTYCIKRHFLRSGAEIIAEGLTLEEAQEHCSDPNSSYKTCTTEEGNKLTAEKGPWFDGYYEE